MPPTPPRAPRLLRTFAMPVDPAAFAGVPSVTALKPLPAAKVLLAAAMDRRVVCCDLTTEAAGPHKGKHLSWFHDNWVHDLDVHPDGKRVATGGTDRRLKLWAWGEDQPLADVKAHDDAVRAVAFSPDGKLLASAGDDGAARLWDADTARPVATLDARARYLDTLAWSADGKHLFGSGHDGRVHVWDIAATTARVNDFGNRRDIEDEPLNGGFSYPGGVRRLACSPDGKLLAAVGLTSLRVAEAATGKDVLKMDGRGFGVAFDPASRLLAFSQEKDLVVYDLAAKAVSHRVQVNQLGLFGVLFLDDGRRLVSGGCNGVVGVWDLTA